MIIHTVGLCLTKPADKKGQITMISILCAIYLTALPPDQAHGFAAYRVAPAGANIIHTTQIFPMADGGLRQQVENGLKQLKDLTGGLDSILRLHVAVAPGVNARELMESLQVAFPHVEKRPALTLVESVIENNGVKVAFDAIAIAAGVNSSGGRSALLPAGGRIDIAGQAEKADGSTAGATRATLESLEKTLEFLGSDKSKVVLIKAFYKNTDESSIVRKTVADYFGGNAPPLVLVQWTMPLPIEIEMVAAVGEKTPVGLRYLTPPGMTTSPVYSRTAIAAGQFDTIYTSGITAPTMNAEISQAKPIFDQLRGVLNETKTDFNHLTKATYYVSNPDANKSLDTIRPTIYDPKRPPTASKAGVTNVIPGEGRGVTIDMIAVRLKN
jgi:enamine deaminase RidA (YjgF/YER057c/UK114 family)